MGQKVSPIGFRIGIRENWRSRWYAKKSDYARYLLEDQKIRKYVKKEYYTSNIACIEIERTRAKVNIILSTAKPGLIIGKKGSNVEKLNLNLGQFISDNREAEVNIKEVINPNVNAQLVSENIAEQLVKRANFRRTMKKTMEDAIKLGVLGIKIQISGRLSGAEMARTESAVWGKVPLQTLDAHIQYGFAEAFTTYGAIGIKVWIYYGEYGEEVVTDGVDAKKSKVQKKPARQSER